MVDQSFADKFWPKLTKGCFVDDCWLFQYRRQPQYFHVQYAPYYLIDGKSIQAHRIAYELAHGVIPTGLVVRHRCAVGGCCNPVHLTIGTPKENRWDRVVRDYLKIELGVLATYENYPELCSCMYQ